MEFTRQRSAQADRDADNHRDDSVDDAPLDPQRVPLHALARLASDLCVVDVQQEAEALAERVVEGRFNVALLGQFKRGKSSLVNALVGMPVLPTGIVPVTAVPTVVRHGARLTVRIQLGDRGWTTAEPEALERFVSEEHNPENRLGVRGVEVAVPAPLLASGMCLVDTPGISSVFAGNTAATHAFLPHVDVALIVVGVDPPLTGDELTLVEAVARHAPAVLVALNKADRFPEEERAEAAAFAERALSARLDRAVGPVFQVSATEQLRNPVGEGDGADRRGWSEMLAALASLQRDSGRLLVRRAHDRGLARLARRLAAEIDEQRSALLRPIEQSERRVAQLKLALDDIASRLGELGPLLAAEQERLEQTFERRREAFLEQAVPSAIASLRDELTALPRLTGPRLRNESIARARDAGREWLTPWLAAEHVAAERAYADGVVRLTGHVNAFLQRVRDIEPALLSCLPEAIPAVARFRVPSRYYYRDLAPLVQGSPLDVLLDLVRPARQMRGAVCRDASAYLGALLEMNSTLVQNDVGDRVLESRRALEAELRVLLTRVAASSERALELARVTQSSGAHAVHAAVQQLDQSRRALDMLVHSPIPSNRTS